ncbi:MAG: methyl-accepting chemotaxis protein [Planctomycetaceae bacterium]|jgi:methyl-accepting chemotaxis protein|nr:methyl-accepting chemotaxis protein [Planctomycetaceae bacterium]
MKIGKKLFFGFGLLTILLIAVGGGGFYALWTIDDEMATVIRRVEQFESASKTSSATYEAEVASGNHSRTHNIKDHEDVVAAAKKTDEAAKHTESLMRTPADREEVEQVTTGVAAYVQLDSEFAEIVKKINDVGVRRKKVTAEATKAVEVMVEMIKKAAAERSQQVNVDGKQVAFVAAERLETLEVGLRLLADTQQVRVLARELEAELDTNKLKDRITALNAAYDNMLTVTKDLRENRLKTEQGRKASDDAEKAINDWKAIAAELAGYLKELNDNQVKQNEKANNVEETLGSVMENIGNKITGASASMASLISSMMYLILGVGIGAVIFGIIAGIVLTKNITPGLSLAVNSMNSISHDGDLTAEIPSVYLRRRDEIGNVSNALVAIIAEFRNVENLAKELAGGNWGQTIKVRGDADAMNINLNAMLDQVNAALGNTAEAVEQVATGASQVASASESLSQGATESAASIEEITASMSEIGGQTNQNAQNANEANRLAKEANDAAGSGQNMMKKMIESMTVITKNSQDVQKVIKVIDDISFQTNLLALNAAVEAARAGAHGKGFAVVAEEVRNLASRSAKAAAETTQMIENNSRQINEGAEIATETAEMLNGIVEQSQKVAVLVGEIAKASSEQAQGITQVSQGLHQIDSVTQQNTAAAEETASVSNEMSGQASQLQKLVGQFRLRKKGGESSPRAESPRAERISPKAASVQKPAPAAASKGGGVVKPAAKPVASAKPVTLAKPAASAAPKAVRGAMPAAHPSEPVAGDNWGGGGNAEIKIDLDDKDFGKY